MVCAVQMHVLFRDPVGLVSKHRVVGLGLNICDYNGLVSQLVSKFLSVGRSIGWRKRLARSYRCQHVAHSRSRAFRAALLDL